MKEDIPGGGDSDPLTRWRAYGATDNFETLRWNVCCFSDNGKVYILLRNNSIFVELVYEEKLTLTWDR